MAESSRHHARELVLQAMYASEVGEVDAEASLDGLIDASTLGLRHAEFARGLLGQVLQYGEEADQTIRELAEHWQLERIATIDRLILRLAMTELRVLPDTPVKVVLNEAIELAKTYSTGQSSAFVNGILDQFIRRGEGMTGTPD
ncbi:transcription antitermination factor NusB [candidate division GN15 bacterium]|nr:transcription antitermination factor NusB [candidate division GN15 bacterium]